MDTASLTSRLQQHVLRSRTRLSTSHPHAISFLKNAGVTPATLREHATKLLASGALAGSLLLAAPALTHIPAATTVIPTGLPQAQRERFLSTSVQLMLPLQVSPLTPDQEQAIHALVHQVWGINATAQLDGERLLQNYGYIGAEQHLPRFPGDDVEQHDAYQDRGVTPGRGAWGYFANSKVALTPDLIQKEKYYVAVQTLYLPDWVSRLSYLRDWYKYRKVVVINPTNGKTIICDIADSGPASYTGKHFGGSPEVMAYLELNVGPQKGPVVLFFVDDPQNQIALGPLEYNGEVAPFAVR